MNIENKAAIAWIVCTASSGLVALAILWSPKVASLLIIACVAITCGLWWLPYLPGIFLGSLGFLLMGYAFGGRNFAYLGVPPLYIGEIVLAVGIFSIIVSGGLQRIFSSPISWVLILFVIWGTIRTLPYLQIYGFNALRDGVIWGYSVFSFLIAAFLLKKNYFVQALSFYQKWIILLLLWIPITLVFGKLTIFQNQFFTGLKTGDAAVHLAGIAGFLMLQLSTKEGHRPPLLGILSDWVPWFLWVIGVILVITQSRGAVLAITLPLFMIFVLRPSWQWGRVIIILASLFLTFLISNVSIDINDERKISSEQILANIQSIFSSSASQNHELSGTKEWRLQWWNDILQYTVWGQYFWTGKGFGINLADDDGYQVLEDSSPLRSPHNGHLTILARAGVPGLILWIILQFGFAFLLIRAFFHARLMRKEWWCKINLWVIVYWAASMINGAFDVFLEGPQGGIWFWCIFGFGLAALIIQHKDGKEILRIKMKVA